MVFSLQCLEFIHKLVLHKLDLIWILDGTVNFMIENRQFIRLIVFQCYIFPTPILKVVSVNIRPANAMVYGLQMFQP